ncbi:MAG: phosphatidylinositol mannoside acyltransferase [Actinobacteria bacterium]|nr:phosphatidylinositol mannoside acyltransferase [Actinomycetota bacterium]
MKYNYYLFAAAEKLIDKVPVRLVRALARAGALIYYFAFPRKRYLVERNMRRALGEAASDREVKSTARRAYRYYADYWVDILWLPTCSRQYVLDRFGRINEDLLTKAVAEGKGVIVVLPHYGSWEAGAVYLSSLSPFAAVAEVLKPPELFDLFVKLRAGVGIKIFPYDHSRETRDEMVSSLRQGTMLALLCDRDLKGSGVEVEFFGERTTLPPGPASLALRSGSPIICVNVRNMDDGTWVGHATEPIYVRDSGDRDQVIQGAMQEVARSLEGLIREDPAQWHMFMPAWPSDRRNP